jgi:hypothetical protein
MTNANKYVGKALYLEFRKGVNTAQIIFTPEGIDSEGAYVPAGTWRRQISTWSPKKPWKCYPAGSADFVTRRKGEATSDKALSNATLDEALELGAEISNEVSVTLNNLFNNDWKLFDKPVVLDFSQEDLSNTRAWETPSALIRRILRARKELGFPDELISEPAE